VDSTPRVLYYAIGGGLGHLVRAGRFLRAQDLADKALILSACEHADDARLNSGVAVRRVPKALRHDLAALRAWLAGAVEQFEPDIVCVDCFPAGILGELAEVTALRGRRLWHVARLLRWNEYAPLATRSPRFELAWQLEPLQPEHEQWLREHADGIRAAPIEIPVAPPQRLGDGRPYWLVAHSGPAEEVRELIDYALELRRLENTEVAIVVASFDPPQPLPDHCLCIDAAPLAGWHAGAQRIFGAAGFNFVAETGAFREKRTVLPFPRRYDDQFERARRARTAL